jgi:PleD family two-component response regulator
MSSPFEGARVLNPKEVLAADDPERARRNAVNQLQRLGYQVTLTPTAAS